MNEYLVKYFRLEICTMLRICPCASVSLTTPASVATFTSSLEKHGTIRDTWPCLVEVTMNGSG